MTVAVHPARLQCNSPSEPFRFLPRSEWGVDDRCALLRLLISLCAESAQLHDTLHGEEDEVGGALGGCRWNA